MADSTQVLIRTILEEASIGRFQLGLTSIEGGLVPADFRDKDGSTFLHLAVWAGNQQSVTALLSAAPALVNTVNTAGTTPLMLATVKGDLATIRTLLRAGADIAVKDSRGADCSLIAAENNRALALLCLHWSGGSLTTVDAAGCGVLHYAAYYDASRVAQLCVSLNLDLQPKDYKGMTPLHRAAISNAGRAAQVLLAAGADPTAVENNGRSVLQAAQDNSSRAVAAVLQTARGWAPRPVLFYLYVVLAGAHYWAFVLPHTAHFLAASLIFINALTVALLLVLSLPRREVLKLHGTDIDSLRSSFQSGDLSTFCHDSDFCFRCMRRRPAHTHHCTVCGHCVPYFDQHSRAFGVCVGSTTRVWFVFAQICLLVALCALVWLDWAAGAWQQMLAALCQWEDRSAPLYALAATLLHVVVLWCVAWPLHMEVRAVGRALTVYEMLHIHECRYLFELCTTSSGAQVLEYSNPADRGVVRNWISFLSN